MLILMMIIMMTTMTMTATIGNSTIEDADDNNHNHNGNTSCNGTKEEKIHPNAYATKPFTCTVIIKKHKIHKPLRKKGQNVSKRKVSINYDL